MTPNRRPDLPDLQPPSARRAAILGALRASGQVRAVRIAGELGVTHETIRKDLLTLEGEGLLRRVHGGAVPIESASFEPVISARTEMAREKSRIAAAALEFLPVSGAVLFDAGTTTTALASMLPSGSSLTAITNALPVATALMVHPQVIVHMLGGRLRKTTMASVDSWALRDLREVRADVAFVGTNAFSLAHGLSTPDAAEAAVKREMVNSARLTVLLADHTKFGREAVFAYADLSDIDVLITDDGLAPADADRLLISAKLEVIRA